MNDNIRGLLPGFVTADFEAPDQGYGSARIRFSRSGSGPPLLLLHGNPMTHVTWHRMAPTLAKRFTVVAADLRGYGDSVGPEHAGEGSRNYTFRAMALDMVALMTSLGFARFQAAGHDRGARTAHRMALDHPDRVSRVAVVDILPNRHIWRNASKQWAMKSWHWPFMAQPYDLPERMMAGVDPRWFMERKLSKPGIGLGVFDPRAFDEYVRCFTWKTICGSCADYRATATTDAAMDDADYDAGRRVTASVLAVWGGRSHTGQVYGDVLAVWRDYCVGPVSGGPLDCGHYVPEEAADGLLAAFEDFFQAA